MEFYLKLIKKNIFHYVLKIIRKLFFGFGIKLNNVQKQAIKKNQELESITYRWYSNYENSINDKSILQKDYVDYLPKII